MEIETTPGSVIKAVLQACALWKLSAAQTCQLLGIDRLTLQRWTNTPPALSALPENGVRRFSCILRIYEALQILLPDPQLADDWIHRPNAALPFSGKRPIELMLSANNEGLRSVRRYLEQEQDYGLATE